MNSLKWSRCGTSLDHILRTSGVRMVKVNGMLRKPVRNQVVKVLESVLYFILLLSHFSRV